MNATLPGETRSGEFVQSLERGLAVLRAFSGAEVQLTLADVARRTELSRAVARRFLHTLVELEYVGTDGKYFFLRPKLLELGHAYLSHLELPELVQPHLQQLTERTGESASVAVLDGQDIVYVARAAVYRIMSVGIRVGTRFPAYATSLGRAILAFSPQDEVETYLATASLQPLTAHTLTDPAAIKHELARVRSRGWALADQELEVGLRSIAAPLRNAQGTVLAALNISAPIRRSVKEIHDELSGPLVETARQIEADIARVGLGSR